MILLRHRVQKMPWILLGEGFLHLAMSNLHLSKLLNIERKNVPQVSRWGSRGIALPHADSDHTLKPGLAIGIAREPIMFGQMADPAEAVLVDIVIMIAAGEADLHMHLLSVVAVAIQDQSFLDGLLSATSRRQVLKLVESCLGVNIRMQSGF